jgi:cell shape-determining protein MreD
LSALERKARVTERMEEACMTIRIDPEELRDLTRRYARFSRSAAGLGSVVGGVFVLVAYFVGALAPLTVWIRAVLVALPFVWLVVREVLRRHLYQRHGRVAEIVQARNRRWHYVFTGFTGLVSTGILVWIATDLLSGRPVPEPGWLALAGYIAFVAALPFLVLFFLWTPLEYIIGIFLIAQAAVVVAGGHYVLGQQIQAPVAAVVLIALGLAQHREFRLLEHRLWGSRSDCGRR